MKKIRKLMALLAISGMATFLTGCGDDDGGDNGNGVIVTGPQSEAQMRALSYTLNVAGDPNAQVLIFPNQNRYQITSAGQTSAGSYSNPTFTANQTTVTLTPDDPEDDAGVLTMTFNQQGQGGSFAFTPTTGPAEQGTFTYTTVVEPPPPPPDTEFAPATQTALEAQTVTANTSSGPVTLTFPSANNYSIVSDGETETGTYTGALDDETWTLNLAPSGGGTSSLVLTWNAATTGNFVYTPQGEPVESGTFSSAGTTPPPPPPGDNAPANIVGAWNLDVQTGPFAGTFIATYDGSSFNIARASDGNPMGSGTYTYTKSGSNGNLATLIHNYGGDFAGDVDNYTLTFSSPTAATFSGTVVSPAGSPPRAASGTFTK